MREDLGRGRLDKVWWAAVVGLSVLREEDAAAGHRPAFEHDLIGDAGRLDNAAIVYDRAVDRGAEAVVELQRGVRFDVERDGSWERERGSVSILQRARFEDD